MLGEWELGRRELHFLPHCPSHLASTLSPAVAMCGAVFIETVICQGLRHARHQAGHSVWII